MKKTIYTTTEENSIKGSAVDKLFTDLTTGYALIKGETDESKKQNLAISFIKSGIYSMLDVLRVNDVATVRDFHDISEVLRNC